MKADDFDGLACGCGDDTQAIICVMPATTKPSEAGVLKVSGFMPGTFNLTRMDTVTGKRDSIEAQTGSDGTLTVPYGGHGCDFAMAMVRSGDATI